MSNMEQAGWGSRLTEVQTELLESLNLGIINTWCH